MQLTLMTRILFYKLRCVCSSTRRRRWRSSSPLRTVTSASMPTKQFPTRAQATLRLLCGLEQHHLHTTITCLGATTLDDRSCLSSLCTTTHACQWISTTMTEDYRGVFISARCRYQVTSHHTTSHGENGSRPQRPLYPRNNDRVHFILHKILYYNTTVSGAMEICFVIIHHVLIDPEFI